MVLQGALRLAFDLNDLALAVPLFSGLFFLPRYCPADILRTSTSFNLPEQGRGYLFLNVSDLRVLTARSAEACENFQFGYWGKFKRLFILLLKLGVTVERLGS